MTFTHALSTNNYGPCKFIVATSAANGTHTTLALALAAASVGDTVFLRDTVTENVTIPAGVNIAAWQGGYVNTPSIIGTVTMTAAGNSTISGVRLVTNGAAAIAVTGSAASVLRVYNCDLDFTNNTGITFSSSNASAIIAFYNCTGNLGTTGIGIYTHTSPGVLSFISTYIDNTGGSSTASTNSAGAVGMSVVGIFSPISVSGTGTFTIFAGFLNSQATNSTSITTANTAQVRIYQSSISSGTATAISIGTGTTVTIYNDVAISSTNASAISGLGSVQYGTIVVPTGFSGVISATTQNPMGVIGGGWSAIKTLTASTSATLDFTTLPVFSTYAIVLRNVLLATNAQQLLMGFSNDNGSTFAATGYTAGANYTSYNSATVTNVNATTSFPLTSAASNGTSISGVIYVSPNSANAWGQTSYLSTTSAVQAFANIGGAGSIVPNAFRFLSSSGNLTSGSIALYGLNQTI